MPHQTAVLFVCLGNICRSPPAKADFRRGAEARGPTSAPRRAPWPSGSRPA